MSRQYIGAIGKWLEGCPLLPGPVDIHTWWRHQKETFSALLTFCAGNSPVTGEFPAQRPVTRSFDVFFDLRLYQQLSKQWRRRWFETPWRSLWRHCNDKHVPNKQKLLHVLAYHKCQILHAAGHQEASSATLNMEKVTGLRIVISHLLTRWEVTPQ